MGFNYRGGAAEDEPPRYHVVDPYEIVFRRGHYYLRCFDRYTRSQSYGQVTQKRTRPLRVSSILDDDRLAVLPEHVAWLPPPEKRAVVRYWLAPAAARHGISRHFEEMQVEREPDGSAVVSGVTTDSWGRGAHAAGLR